ncbi:hypothetical protein HDV01_002022 [Terramyces sp. JEL0728]|nr:hypothetical protein HDV01_002022 [Terramyces sp. JEL0728]
MKNVIIRLWDSQGKEIIDSVSGEYEDSFTLDSFADLCQMHLDSEPKNRKGYIIARVQTWDPKQPDKIFYSYYNAFHLNKILFQTQIYLKQRYIHRLHVLNPLTNSDVIGNVLYFHVSPPLSELEAKRAQTLKMAQEKEKGITPVIKDTENGVEDDWTINGHLIAKDDPSDSGEATVRYKGTVKLPSTICRPSFSTGGEKLVQVQANQIFPPSPKRRISDITLTAKLPNRKLHMNTLQKINIPSGLITRFTVPLPKDEFERLIPATKKGHRRCLSYRNAISATGVPATFLEWTKMIQEDRQTVDNLPECENNFDHVKPYMITSTTLASPEQITPDTPCGEETVMYDGYLFATDSDYLKSSEIRQVFRSNAINYEEIRLFEMDEYKGELEQEESQASLCEWMLLEGEGDAQEVTDSISGDYEDSFCLETFEDLVKMHFNTEPKDTKGFVIARVQTLDPKMPGKAFYSYYNAFHLNKTLFQTQIYLKKRYIHRLHVLNPLTNSDIIGNVMYYIVKPVPQTNPEVAITIDPPAPQTEDSSAPLNLNAEKAATTSASRKSDIGRKSEGPRKSAGATGPPQPAPNTSDRRKSSLKPRLSIQISSNKSSGSQQSPLSPSSRTPMSPLPNIPMVNPAGQDLAQVTVTTHKVTYEEASQSKNVPAMVNQFKRKFSTPLIDTKREEVEPGKGRRQTLFEFPITQVTSPVKQDRRGSAVLNVTSMLPTGQLMVNGNNQVKVEPGVITRFAVPIPKEELQNIVPKTQKGHRRSLSYRNAVSASGAPASFLEWTKMVEEEKKMLKNQQTEPEGDHYDQVRPFSATAELPSGVKSPLSPGVKTPLSSQLETIQDNEDEELPVIQMNKLDGFAEPEEEKETIFYDAVYFANDNEFLETSKIRQIFRNNAINPEDAKLFEMKEYTGEETNQQDFEIIGEAFPCECCYPSDEELNRMSPALRFLHNHKCILLASSICTIVIVFILVMMLTSLTTKSS